ncbi:MAG: YafY family transcriptional regulator [Acidimicrobiales bacterium]|nr:YafY family transcriptional regulator [Acidimicrobiales bacterium]
MTGFIGEDQSVRADRLVAILILLQTRGQVTAAEVAAELEVSERTARRDLDALGTAGLPIYSVQGRNGGWRLLGDGRTDLSGLTAQEARALFLVAGPQAASPELRAALRKLVRALPESFRDEAEAASGAVVVDPVGWDGDARNQPPTPPLLDDVQEAVVAGSQLLLHYVSRDGSTTERVIHPLGLASKGPRWYLVADTEAGLRTFRVDRMRSVQPTGEAVVRPDGFDLAEAWTLITGEVERIRAPLLVEARVDPRALGWCRANFGTRLSIGPAEKDGRIAVELRGHSFASVAREIAGFGSMIEVLSPSEVRAGLRGLATEFEALYSGA